MKLLWKQTQQPSMTFYKNMYTGVFSLNTRYLAPVGKVLGANGALHAFYGSGRNRENIFSIRKNILEAVSIFTFSNQLNPISQMYTLKRLF